MNQVNKWIKVSEYISTHSVLLLESLKTKINLYMVSPIKDNKIIGNSINKLEIDNTDYVSEIRSELFEDISRLDLSNAPYEITEYDKIVENINLTVCGITSRVFTKLKYGYELDRNLSNREECEVDEHVEQFKIDDILSTSKYVIIFKNKTEEIRFKIDLKKSENWNKVDLSSIVVSKRLCSGEWEQVGVLSGDSVVSDVNLKQSDYSIELNTLVEKLPELCSKILSNDV